MKDKRFFDEVEVDGKFVDLFDGDPRFESVGAVPNTLKNDIHHVRSSVKYESDARLELQSIAIQPFVDENTPHGRMGVQLDPRSFDDFLSDLYVIENDYLR